MWSHHESHLHINNREMRVVLDHVAPAAGRPFTGPATRQLMTGSATGQIMTGPVTRKLMTSQVLVS
ncbi:hypothetical protein DPMN_034885 [Dreissena polymorpha]|uniref:Uncharacterized protein n=1 Tax=Dreissena polymorpha TaxID=45954 RepID=A0A9D4M9H5_DREPO|nr:hypothetical protein DPMN_034885 [Dreissena polymorpha]